VSWPPWRTTHLRIKDIDIYELGRRPTLTSRTRPTS
jgi:hypothetical protein